MRSGVGSSCDRLRASPRGPNRCPNPPPVLYDQRGQTTDRSPPHSPRSSSGAQCAALTLGTRFDV
eukprot:3502627-Prymnesium_polylepis.2